MRYPKLTIAQQRWQEVKRLALFHSDDPTEADLQEASRLMNSLYRLVGLSERNCNWSNNERTCNSKWLADSEDREMRWMKRLDNEFREFCGLHLMWPGIYPLIVDQDGYSRVGMHYYR